MSNYTKLLKKFADEVNNGYITHLRSISLSELYKEENPVVKRIKEADGLEDEEFLPHVEKWMNEETFIAYFYDEKTGVLSSVCLEKIVIKPEYKDLFSDSDITSIAERRIKRVRDSINDLKSKALW